MVRIVNLFYTNGIAALLVLGQDNDGSYSYSCKIILLYPSSNKEEIGYIINEAGILMESGRTVNINGIYLPQIAQEEGVWLNLCDNVQL